VKIVGMTTFVATFFMETAGVEPTVSKYWYINSCGGNWFFWLRFWLRWL